MTDKEAGIRGRSRETASPVRRAEYANESVRRACEILRCFHGEQEVLKLDEMTQRVGLPKPTVFRMAYTLVECGMLERRGKNLYALCPADRHRKRLRFGFAGETEEYSFARIVRESMQQSAYEAGVELIVLDNRYSATRAVRNAEHFVDESVDLVIEFQVHHEAAVKVATTLAKAGIPLIAIEIPHPGAYFYGANNYRAGWIGGQYLAEICIAEWKGRCDELILIGLPIAGAIPQTRMTGTVAGVRDLMPNLSDLNVVSLNGNGRYETSLEAVRRHLRKSKANHVLIAGINDPSSLGALHAFEEAGRAQNCLVVGQNASIDARREIRQAKSRMIGSVAYFPERYGDEILSFAKDILNGREVPPTLFVNHRLVTKQNVDLLYPNDTLVPEDGADSLLFSSR